MKASGIVYLVLNGYPIPAGMTGHPARTHQRHAERALMREETIHAFLSQLIRARAFWRLDRVAATDDCRTCEDVWRARRDSARQGI